MKFLNGQCNVEIKDKRFLIHATENIILRKRNPHYFSELNINYKPQLKLVKIKR